MTLLERAAFAAACAHHNASSVDSETAARFTPIARAVIEAIREPQEGEERMIVIHRQVMVDKLLAVPGECDHVMLTGAALCLKCHSALTG